LSKRSEVRQISAKSLLIIQTSDQTPGEVTPITVVVNWLRDAGR